MHVAKRTTRRPRTAVARGGGVKGGGTRRRRRLTLTKKRRTTARISRGGNKSMSQQLSTVPPSINRLEKLPIPLYAEVLSSLTVDELKNLAITGPFFQRRLPELVNIGFTFRPNRPLTTDEVQQFKSWGISLQQYVEHRVQTGANSKRVLEMWYLNGNTLHNDSGPAIVDTRPNRIFTEYYKYGKFHRDDGPAKVEMFTDGKFNKSWFRNGLQGRGNGAPPGEPGSKPAYISFHPGGFTRPPRVYRMWYDSNGKYIGNSSGEELLDEDLDDSM